MSGKFTTGANVVDFYNLLKLEPNAEVIYDLDRKAFVKLLYETVQKLP